MGTNIASYAPLIGNKIKILLLGGHTIGASALLRFYVLHVLVLPGAMVLLIMVHFWRLRKDGGLSRPVWKLRRDATSVAAEVVPASTDKTYGLMEVVTGKPLFETVAPFEENELAFSYPFAFFREGIAFLFTSAFIMALSLFFNAPLEELANPAKTPNPAKAPWYFLGLQELVSHSAFIGGVLVPTAMVLCLLAIPYLDRNPSRLPQKRRWAIAVFSAFTLANVVLILIGYFCRGEGWAFVWPWAHHLAGAH